MSPEILERFRKAFYKVYLDNPQAEALAQAGCELLGEINRLQAAMPVKESGTQLFVWGRHPMLIEATHIAGAQEKVIQYLIKTYGYTSAKAWDRLSETGGMHALLNLERL